MKNKKIKILIMLSSIDIGGAELLVLNICRGLLKKNPDFEIHLLTYFKGSTLKNEFEQAGVIVKQLLLPDKSSIFNILKKIFLPLVYIIKIHPSIVHTHLLDTDRYGLLSAFLGGIKHRFSTVHNIEKNEESGFKLTRKIVSILASKITFVSNCTLQYYTSNNSYPLQKCIVIYNSPSFTVDSDIFPKCVNNTKSVVSIVNIGRLNLQKGQIYLIQAMKHLQSSTYNFTLNIYGGDYLSFQPTLEKEIEQLNLSNVTFNGITRNIKDILLKSDIIVASSLFEGFHMVVVEAMSLGIPVIATDIPPHHEILDPIKIYKSFVPTADPDAIKNAILYLLDNGDYYTELSRQEILRAKDFSQEKMIDNYYNLYFNK